MWLSDRIDQGKIQPSRAAHRCDGPQSVSELIRDYYHEIPILMLPSIEEIEEFSAFFSTYLTSSFDVVEKPGTRGDGPLVCTCDICMRLRNAPHLQTKKLYAREKREANLLMLECLEQLANENQLDCDEDKLKKIASDPATQQDAAYLTYGHWLIERLTGESAGPAILVLWRLIAWDPRGGMRQGFTLEIDDFKAAEKKLIEALLGT